MGIGAEQTAVKEGFALPSTGPLKIVVFRPDIHVGAQSTAGLDEPNAEWTRAARDLIASELARQLGAKSTDMAMMPDYEGADAQLVADYRAMFRTVAGAVVEHKLYPGNRLPTKRDRFDWTLGPGIAEIAALTGGDYGLFVFTHDSYGSDGRKALQIIGLLLGAGLPSSGVHIGYAGLVDLRTGDLVWINADLQMGGDVRKPDGAAKRVAQLLEEFPERAAVAPATVGTDMPVESEQ
ncbi:MAG: hypothetical protein GW859_04460 [Sphingomonadales bacterium]|nr:hypothetical protein [Sphingomonadales bacterium]